jgi:hypothetical protein
VLQDAIREHLAIIRQLTTQQDVFSRVATLPVNCLLRRNNPVSHGAGQRLLSRKKFEHAGEIL